MKITSDIFGVLKEEDGSIYKQIELSLNGISQNCSFFTSIQSKKRLEESISFLDKNFIALNQQSKESIVNLYKNGNSIVKDFVQCQLDEIKEALLEKFNVKEISLEFFLTKLKLSGVSIQDSNDQESFKINFDYCIDEELSDELLVLYFDKNGEFILVAHES